MCVGDALPPFALSYRSARATEPVRAELVEALGAVRPCLIESWARPGLVQQSAMQPIKHTLPAQSASIPQRERAGMRARASTGRSLAFSPEPVEGSARMVCMQRAQTATAFLQEPNEAPHAPS